LSPRRAKIFCFIDTLSYAPRSLDAERAAADAALYYDSHDADAA